MTNSEETVLLGSDHAGLEMKRALVPILEGQGVSTLDLGTHTSQSVDYPDFANALAQAIAVGQGARGLLICGSGIGISIAANRHPHLRAALCRTSTDAKLARQHNDANVLVLGARTTGLEVAADCVKTFLGTGFEGGRHVKRVAKLSPQ